MQFGTGHWLMTLVIVLVVFYVGRKTTLAQGLFAPLTN
jgi:hypothetical protein